MSDAFELKRFPIHLDGHAAAFQEPEIDWSPSWFAHYASRHGGEGRLVSMGEMSGPWKHWEMHPSGDEVVVCIEGEFTLIQDRDGEHASIALRAGEYAINPAGVWHTADAAGPARALYITAGAGTEHRPRHDAADTKPV